VANYLGFQTPTPPNPERVGAAQLAGTLTPTPPNPERVGAAQLAGTLTPTPPNPERVGAAQLAAVFRDAFVSSGSGGGGSGVIIPTTGQIFPHPSYGGNPS
jgi:hypothetical protein